MGKIAGNSGFCVIPSSFDESQIIETDPYNYAKISAKSKAQDVYCKTGEYGADRLVLGADTIVFAGGKILGKPKDNADAKRLLGLVTGEKHTVITAVCLVKNGEFCEIQEATTLHIDALSDKEIDEYIATGSPADKAGAYGVQDKIIKEKLRLLDGSFSNVVGLPALAVQKMLTEKGWL